MFPCDQFFCFEFGYFPKKKHSLYKLRPSLPPAFCWKPQVLADSFQVNKLFYISLLIIFQNSLIFGKAILFLFQGSHFLWPNFTVIQIFLGVRLVSTKHFIQAFHYLFIASITAFSIFKFPQSMPQPLNDANWQLTLTLFPANWYLVRVWFDTHRPNSDFHQAWTKLRRP